MTTASEISDVMAKVLLKSFLVFSYYIAHVTKKAQYKNIICS